MGVLYNLTNRVNDNHGMPKDIYDASVKVVTDAGLIGKLHVIDSGKVLPGHADSDVYKEGRFDIFYHEGMTESLSEMTRRARLTTSGFDDKKMQAVQVGEDIANLLEKHDPMAALPFDLYMNLPYIHSMSIHTPAGYQDTHVHTPDHWSIRFWKAELENQWYDYDVVKNYAFDLMIDVMDVFEKPLLARWWWQLTNFKRRLKVNLGERLMMNPDDVKTVSTNFLRVLLHPGEYSSPFRKKIMQEKNQKNFL